MGGFSLRQFIASKKIKDSLAAYSTTHICSGEMEKDEYRLAKDSLIWITRGVGSGLADLVIEQRCSKPVQVTDFFLLFN